jgi:hypothetical protein
MKWLSVRSGGGKRPTPVEHLGARPPAFSIAAQAVELIDPMSDGSLESDLIERASVTVKICCKERVRQLYTSEVYW